MSRLSATLSKIGIMVGEDDSSRAASATTDLTDDTPFIHDYKPTLHPQLVSLVEPGSPDAERYRRLRHSVEKLKQPDSGLIIGITSPLPGDGKTLTAINLAGTLAQNPQSRVLLLELDMRRPYASVKDYLGIKEPTETGVSDLIADPSLPWDQAGYYFSEFNLHVMPAGSHRNAPYELLASERMGALLAQARQRYDYIIIDTAPVVLLPDSQLISKWVDGFLVLIAADITTRKILEEALDLMEQDKVLGLIFNGYAPVNTGYDAYYQYQST